MALIKCSGGDIYNAVMLGCINISTAYYSSSGHAVASVFDCVSGEYALGTGSSGTTISASLNGFVFTYNYSTSSTTAHVTAPYDCEFYYNGTKIADLTAGTEYTWNGCPNFGGDSAQQSQHVYNLRFLKP